MFLQQLPDVLRWAFLFFAGAAIGSLVNLAIYRLARFVNRNISPWSIAPAADRERSSLDRIPIVGWFLLRRESDVYGKGHWIRPMLIEVAMGAGFAWFYHWNLNGGLYSGDSIQLTKAQSGMAAEWNVAWFLFHSVLIALMVVATFIDFDEQTIPDWVTIPGTVFALVGYALFPELRLPVMFAELLNTILEPLDFWSPGESVAWHTSSWGVVAALAIILIWCFALVHKRTTLRWGLVRGARIMVASIIRPLRKTTASVPRVTPRKMTTETKVLFGLAIGLSGLVCLMFGVIGGERWTAFFDSLLGLAMGGGIVWSVRIIAGKALGVEAMGFGDVTLMCMIGAFLGWQVALLAFVIAPFTSIVIALLQLVTSGENHLAFGPYLCLATVIVLIGWKDVWNRWAADGVFAMGGPFLLLVILVCLVLMAVMLGIWGKIKYRDV